MTMLTVLLTFLLSVVLLRGTVHAQDSSAWKSNGRSVIERCTALASAGYGEPGNAVSIISAVLHDATDSSAPPPGTPGWAVPAMPQHCEVVGEAGARTGTDGQRYAIGFRLRLPVEWKGRLLFQGGGGTDGNLGDATGAVMAGAPTALDRGFAVISTDAGHDNRTNSSPDRQGAVAFGFDYQARLDYAERSLEVVAQIGKKFVDMFYGQAPTYSYFLGCSNGGRQGMVFAQRFPWFFDGIVASAPAFSLPKAAIAQAWDTQTFDWLARQMGLVDGDGVPEMNRVLSDEDLAMVSTAVLEACDGDDGVVDGIAGDFITCTTERVLPRLEAMTCPGEKDAGCLTGDQIEALRRVHAGPHDSKGKALYSDWPWDAGIGGRIGDGYHMGWRIWKIGMYQGGPFRYSINITLGSPALSALFITPPTPVPDEPRAHLAYQLEFDMDIDAPKIFATTPDFPRSSWELIAAKESDLSAFHERGGKMIVPHGVSDPVFSIHDTRRWWEAVDVASGGKASTFVRVFAIPGMAHCGGGPSTDQYDALTAIMEWVEEGVAPDRVIATAGEATPWPGRTRPLCPYPLVARYSGEGSIEEASNFECR